MPQIRDRIFLATKTGRRDRESAWREINASLERLQTDRVDLLQLHAVGDLGELDLATGPDGALEAAVRALDEGLVGRGRHHRSRLRGRRRPTWRRCGATRSRPC